MTGSQLRKRREALAGANGRPMSLQEFATHAGIGWSTLQRYETQQPRTELTKRNLDPMRVDRVINTLERLENGAG